MQPNARMTFRFDPVKQVKPAPAPTPAQAAEAEEKDEVPTSIPPRERVALYTGGPLQDDPFTLEELIRQTAPVPMKTLEAEMPSGNPATNDETLPGWVVPEDQLHAVYHTVVTSSRREGPSWWKVFASVGGAIATGALFGYLLLTLFAGDTPFPSKPASGTDARAEATAGPETVASPSARTSPAAGTSSAVELPGETYYLLQYGAFRSEESMDAAVQELKGKGYPGTADRADGFRVYAGAAATKEEAELLAAQMPGLLLYIKPAEAIPVSTSKAGAEGESFVRRSHELAKALSALSITALGDEKPQPIAEEKMAALRVSYRAWQETADAAERMDEPARESSRAIARALNAAMVSLDDYGRNVSRYHLWGIQKDVTEVILADRQLRSSLQDG